VAEDEREGRPACRLETLSLSLNPLAVDGMDALAKALRNNRCLRVLRLEYITSYQRDPANLLGAILAADTRIEHLALNYNYYSACNSPVERIMSQLATNQSLRVLDMRRCCVGGWRRARAIARGVMSNQSVTQLDLSYNGLGAAQAAQASNLSLSLAVNTLCTAFSRNSTLRSVNLAHNALGDTGSDAIVRAVMDGQAITHLDLHSNLITAQGVRVIAGKLHAAGHTWLPLAMHTHARHVREACADGAFAQLAEAVSRQPTTEGSAGAGAAGLLCVPQSAALRGRQGGPGAEERSTLCVDLHENMGIAQLLVQEEEEEEGCYARRGPGAWWRTCAARAVGLHTAASRLAQRSSDPLRATTPPHAGSAAADAGASADGIGGPAAKRKARTWDGDAAMEAADAGMSSAGTAYPGAAHVGGGSSARGGGGGSGASLSEAEALAGMELRDEAERGRDDPRSMGEEGGEEEILDGNASVLPEARESPQLVALRCELSLAQKAQQPSPYHMARQREVNTSMRRILVDWLIELYEELALPPHVLFAGVHAVDRFLSVTVVRKESLQLVGAVALMLCSNNYCKLLSQDGDPMELRGLATADDVVYWTDNTYTVAEVAAMEARLMHRLGVGVCEPVFAHQSPLHFLTKLAALLPLRDEVASIAHELLVKSTREYHLLAFHPSILAATSIVIAVRSWHSHPLPHEDLHLSPAARSPSRACGVSISPDGLPDEATLYACTGHTGAEVRQCEAAFARHMQVDVPFTCHSIATGLRSTRNISVELDLREHSEAPVLATAAFPPGYAACL